MPRDAATARACVAACLFPLCVLCSRAHPVSKAPIVPVCVCLDECMWAKGPRAAPVPAPLFAPISGCFLGVPPAPPPCLLTPFPPRASQFHSPYLRTSDFEAKPMVLLLGQYSVGKTSFIRFLLGRDYPGIRIGAGPLPRHSVAVVLFPAPLPHPRPHSLSLVQACVGIPCVWGLLGSACPLPPPHKTVYYRFMCARVCVRLPQAQSRRQIASSP